MNSSKNLTLGVIVFAILAFSGCLDGGSKVQVFENDWGKVQFELPKEVPLTSVVEPSRTVLSIEETFIPFIYVDFIDYSAIKESSSSFIEEKLGNRVDDIHTDDSDDNHKIYWGRDLFRYTKDNSDLELPPGVFLWRGYIDYTADKNLLIGIIALSAYADPTSGKYIDAFDNDGFHSTLKSFAFLESKTRATGIDLEAGPEAITETSTQRPQEILNGRQQLVKAISDLENATLDSVDYSTHQTADSYALLATAGELTTWWGEASRLALDTINSVVGIAMSADQLAQFLTPQGALKALNDPETYTLTVKNIKSKRDTVSAISALCAFRGLYRDAESYKLSFDALSKIEDAARKEYKVSEDNTRAANVAWLELWMPSTPYGLLIPLKSGTASENDTPNSIAWVNGIKATEKEIKKSFDHVVTQIPDPLPSDYPLDETLTYLEDLTNNLKQGDNRVVGFNVIRNGEIKNRAVALGLAQADREIANQLYDAWMNKQDVQYDSTLYNTGKTIISLTTYGIKKGVVPVTQSGKPIINYGYETLEYLDAVRFLEEFPTGSADEISKLVDPLGALQGHSISMTNDLITEVSNLWTISDETLRYLQYTLGSSPTEISSTTSESERSVPLTDSENAQMKEEAVHEETKIAYSRDGTNFLSKERMEQNIKYGLGKPEDYREVQVPLDTIIMEASPE